MSSRTSLPVVPLRDTVLFPGIATPVTVGRLKTLRAIEAGLRGDEDDKLVFAAAQRDNAEEPTIEGLYTVGVVARIAQVQRFGTGLQLVLACDRRATAIRYFEDDGLIRAITVDLMEIPPRATESGVITALAREVRERAIEYGRHRGTPEDVLKQFLGTLDEVGALADHVAFYLDLSTPEKQHLLETVSVDERLRRLAALLHRQIGIVETQERIRTSVQEELGERQREMYLREQMRAIQKELGEDDQEKTADRLEAKLRELDLPSEAEDEVRRELSRLRRMVRDTMPEAQVITTWLEWVAELPWNRRTDDHVDLEEARRILDEDHYGLGDVKDRVLEFLAVRRLRLLGMKAGGPGAGATGAKEAGKAGEAAAGSPQEGANGGAALSLDGKGGGPRAGDKAHAVAHGPILLFIGPPGTGKTSIAASIARAMGRKYVRVSLGGVRDEADIRGHRRTYVGAMPGRILQGMKRAGTKNPVFTLDEVDKLGVSYQGDPAAALLEVLDPAQNATFVDHYLGVAFDLSEVLFVCTANFRDGIPPALLDRMELIAFAGYTEHEKLEIARRYLVPRQTAENGLRDDQLLLGDDAIRHLIAAHTREAGVRQLERSIAAVARKAARRIAAGEALRVLAATPEHVRDLVGRPRIRPERGLERDEPGVATGMYYTEAGGDVMMVEASVMPGKGDLVLTGQLGEVMKESGRAAVTWTRTHATELGIPLERLEHRDIHVHVPAGAVPKDGPSAGVTMTTAIVSALCGRPVRRDIAMTGEITLRGRVLPIGGIKEKILGAHRAGIPEVILPRDNEPELDDLPDEVRKSLQFHLVDSLDEVIRLALRPHVPLPAAELTHAPPVRG